MGESLHAHEQSIKVPSLSLSRSLSLSLTSRFLSRSQSLRLPVSRSSCVARPLSLSPPTRAAIKEPATDEDGDEYTHVPQGETLPLYAK